MQNNIAVYIVRRLLAAIPILIGVTLLTYTLVEGTTDPERLLQGHRQDQASLEAIREKYGFNDPHWKRYLSFVTGALRGDLGRSLAFNFEVGEEIARRFPATALLALTSLAIAILVGVGLGVLSALYHSRWQDGFISLFALVGISFPIFALAVFLQLLFSVSLGWLPVTGYVDRSWSTLILPSAALATRPMAVIARLMRSSMIETLRSPYITTARAKGLGRAAVLAKHAFKNALNPVLTAISGSLAELLAGAFFIELIFNWPGIGKLGFDAVTRSDPFLLEGTVLVSAVIFILVNLVTDILYCLVDPRVRLNR
ncbi:MAG: ABC transporter permease [Candidatus Omnitrophica bacterium]|nr:Glutathione transport system permease protein GsiC [bacterium]NUN97331.1 ABC transporter permease [Candidatus Omnitrophota bacterium]